MDEKGHTNFLPTFGTLELCLAPACNAGIGTRQLDDRLCPVVDTSDDAKLVSAICYILFMPFYKSGSIAVSSDAGMAKDGWN